MNWFNESLLNKLSYKKRKEYVSDITKLRDSIPESSLTLQFWGGLFYPIALYLIILPLYKIAFGIGLLIPLLYAGTILLQFILIGTLVLFLSDITLKVLYLYLRNNIRRKYFMLEIKARNNERNKR